MESRDEARVWATFVLCVSTLILFQMGSCFYHGNILPARMAERGYCEVGRDKEGFSLGWQPCHTAIEKK